MKSPCIRDCVLDQGKCRGCLRTPSEIATWLLLPNNMKQRIIDRINAEKQGKPNEQTSRKS